ncbi:PIN-like domain-containing protein [Peribacillus frigoritolerans]|uniref:PIN-like domain-containing protein n=1 Tax=Peribacillus frigoritolerans TaxID=450367 RepID=UPI0039A29FDB
MKKMFAGLIEYNDVEIKEIWESAIFVIDTNVLTNFFKVSSHDYITTLLKILSDLKEKKRLWIPHQVALEFLYNYEKSMYQPKRGIELLSKKLTKLENEAIKAFATHQSEHPSVNVDNFKHILDDFKTIPNKISELEKMEISYLPNPEEIKEKIYSLLDGIIGKQYPQEKLNEIEKQGEERYPQDIPPGFEDAKKEGFRIFGRMKYQQKYGDLILWNQIIDYVKTSDNPSPIIFITEEKKIDWWEHGENKKIKRPQPQLIQEFFLETEQSFYMYRTDNFVKYAKQFLELDVTKEQEENVSKTVEQLRETESQEELESSIEVKSNSRLIKEKFNNAVNDNDFIISYNDYYNNKMFEYLSTETKKRFLDRLSITSDSPLSENQKKLTMDIAFQLLVQEAFPIILDHYTDLTDQISRIDRDYGENAKNLLNNLPESNTVKIKLLLREIDKIEEELQAYTLR